MSDNLAITTVSIIRFVWSKTDLMVLPPRRVGLSFCQRHPASDSSTGYAPDAPSQESSFLHSRRLLVPNAQGYFTVLPCLSALVYVNRQ